MLEFDESKLVTMLKRLPAPLRVAFAAACAERQIPAYRIFSSQTGQGDPDALQRTLDDLWAEPSTTRGEPELERQVKEVLGVIPQEEGFVGPWTQQATNAQNAGMSLVYALRARLNGEAQEAAWSALVAYEALDNFVINHEDIDTNEPAGEHKVLSHQLVQAELARQQRDLEDLLAADGRDLKGVFSRLRERAKLDAAKFLAPGS
jgi:uncharacterized protein YjaG (DUF416 family)